MYMRPLSPGLQVIEVVHDMQLAVRRYLKQDLNLVNSFDTWHGMKLTVMVFSQDVCTGVTTLHRNQECCQMILDLCYHPYYPCLYAFGSPSLLSFQIFCNFFYTCFCPFFLYSYIIAI